MKYDRKQLLRSWDPEKKDQPQILPFYGHSVTMEITSTCLSQWYPCQFEVGGVSYHTAEQYMMAQKAKLFGDMEIYEMILEAEDPKTFKSLGRKVKGFDKVLWDEHKDEIVIEGNFAKFSQNRDLGEYLLNTGDSILVEASPRDLIWGVGLGKENPRIQDPASWRGQNHLGFALMEVRDRLKELKDQF